MTRDELRGVELFDLGYIIERGEIEFVGCCGCYEGLAAKGLVEISEPWGPRKRRVVKATDAGRALMAARGDS